MGQCTFAVLSGLYRWLGRWFTDSLANYCGGHLDKYDQLHVEIWLNKAKDYWVCGNV